MPELGKPLVQHDAFWRRFESGYNKEQIPQALLLSGSIDMQLAHLAQTFGAALLCEKASSSDYCGNCQSCHLISIQEHPDLIVLQPEKAPGQIKIDQVRLLKTRLQTFPKLGKKRVIIINPANKMNVNAANALLKILEEPPQSTYFLLIAECTNTIPLTIRSRCQSHVFSTPHSIGLNYSTAYLERAVGNKQTLLSEYAGMVEYLCQLKAQKISAYVLASKWSSLDFTDLVWLLYVVHAEMLMYFFGGFIKKTDTDAKLLGLAQQLQPVLLFAQLDKLQEISRLLGSAVSVNVLLWLETFLLAFNSND